MSINVSLNLNLVLVILGLLIECSQCQTGAPAVTSLSVIDLKAPTDCSANEYYDISHLTCVPCPTNTEKLDLYNCICLPNYRIRTNYGGGQVTCEACAANYRQSTDGYSCVVCNTVCQNCPNTSGYVTSTNENGVTSTNARCVTCDSANSILLNGQCVSCKPFVFTVSASGNIAGVSCNQPFIRSAGILILNDGSVTVSSYDFDVTFGSDRFTSTYLSNQLVGLYQTCRDTTRRNVTSCEALGNLCALKLYAFNLISNNIDACTLFENTVNILLSSQSNAANQFWDANAPWLIYPVTFGTYKSAYDATGISTTGTAQYLNLKLDNRCKSSVLSFYAAKYNLQGDLLSFGPVDISEFQLCNFLTTSFALASDVSPFAATNYQQKCSITVGSLLKYGETPVFYDLYLKYSNSSKLFPVPVDTINYSENGNTVNTGLPSSNDRLQRRFFLAESVTSLVSSSSQVPKYVRYAKSITIRFELAVGQTDGRIYPPLVIINYDYVAADKTEKTVDVSFAISYVMNLDTQTIVVWAVIGALSGLGFFWAIFRTWIWNRRSGKMAPDLVTVIKFFLFLINALSNIFFAVLVVFSIFWLIFYKGQSLAFVVIPQPAQETGFVTILVVAFVFKLIDILHVILSQTSYDLFFIDWEKPKSTEYSSELISDFLPNLKSGKEVKKEPKVVRQEIREYNKISCWRTLFVANEWNEIQTFRKISPTIQLIFVLFFLKVVNLEAITTSDCNTSISPDKNSYQAPYSGILRVAMAASMYLGMGLVQYIFYLFVYIRFFQDRISQFVDFCSVTNISMFIMTHTEYGYYIHGKSVHGNSEVSMHQMRQALLKEQNDISPKRGLDPNNDLQTFSISISSRLTKQYSKVIKPLLERKTPRTSDPIITNDYEKRVLAYAQLNKFLMGFIARILRDMSYKITKRNFIENLFDIEFKEPTEQGFFYEDEDKSFESVIFCGQERKFLVFDLLVFLIVDYFIQNYVLAAFVCYIVINIYNSIRYDLGRRNLSKKTLVDKRFLI